MSISIMPWKNYTTSGKLFSYALGTVMGVFLMDGGCSKDRKAIEQLKENATPITKTVVQISHGDTIAVKKDTIAYQVAAKAFSPK